MMKSIYINIPLKDLVAARARPAKPCSDHHRRGSGRFEYYVEAGMTLISFDDV